MAENNENLTPKDAALAPLQSEWQQTLVEEAAKAGVTRSDDTLWSVVGFMVEAWAAADDSQESSQKAAAASEAVSKSIDQLQQSLAQVPTDASKAVLEAGKTAAGEVESSIRGTTDKQIERVNDSVADTVQQKLKNGGDKLIEQIGNAFAKGKTEIDQYKKDKVTEFKGDLKDAAYEVTASELTKARNWSFTYGAAAVLLGVFITIGGSHFWEVYGPGWFQTDQVFHHCSHGKNGHMWCRLPIQHHHH